MVRQPAGLGDEGDPTLDVWKPGRDGRPIDPEPHRTTEEVISEATAEVVRRVTDYARDPSAVRGYRPGGYGDRSTSRPLLVSGSGAASAPGLAWSGRRSGKAGEILKPLRVRPVETARVIDAGGLFLPPLDHLHVDEQRLRRDGDMFAWPVVVRTGLIARVRATLVLRPSPSCNLTLMELTPRRRSWFQTRPFIRVGIRAVDELGQRLARQAAAVSPPRRWPATPSLG